LELLERRNEENEDGAEKRLSKKPKVELLDYSSFVDGEFIDLM
jgi:hypothetical protein